MSGYGLTLSSMASGEPSEEDRAFVRAAADDIIATARDRNYVTMARGTLAALDWLEGHTDRTPSTGVTARPEHVLELGRRGPTALQHERNWSEDWGRGHVRPPVEDMHFHGAVWALLNWWLNSDGSVGLAIWVPEFKPREAAALERIRRDRERFYADQQARRQASRSLPSSAPRSSSS